MVALFPSLISGDLLNLQEQIRQLEPYCRGFHLDIMDFHFVPNLTWGPDFVNAIRQATKSNIWVHLMVEYPENYLDRLNLHKHDIVSVHIESPSELSFPDLLNKIRSLGMTPSIALSPFTPIESIIGLTTHIEHILLMSVNPGFSGQDFLPHTFDRLKALINFKKAHNLSFTIAVDGGITIAIAQQLALLGAEQFAVASALFNSGNIITALRDFNSIDIRK